MTKQQVFGLSGFQIISRDMIGEACGFIKHKGEMDDGLQQTKTLNNTHACGF